MADPFPSPASAPAPHEVHLVPGAQAIINGALVTAREHCVIDVSAGSFVLTGRAMWRDKPDARHPADELYFSVLEAGIDADAFFEARFRLFRLLGEVVARDRSYEAQRECALCAAAIIAGNAKDATESAARLSSERMASHRSRRKIPGRKAARRAQAAQAAQAEQAAQAGGSA